MKWRVLAVSVGVMCLASAAYAGWKASTPVSMKINGHAFDKLAVVADECEVKVTFWFDAPPDKYESRAKNRNYHRFKGRVLFANGKAITTQVFYNDKPGRRHFTYRHDTSDEGCWSKTETKLKDVDVVGCRAKGCKLKAFARVLPAYD